MLLLHIVLLYIVLFYIMLLYIVLLYIVLLYIVLLYIVLFYIVLLSTRSNTHTNTHTHPDREAGLWVGDPGLGRGPEPFFLHTLPPCSKCAPSHCWPR